MKKSLRIQPIKTSSDSIILILNLHRDAGFFVLKRVNEIVDQEYSYF